MKKSFFIPGMVASVVLTTSIACAGDFNDDNKSDILWKKADGNHKISLMVDGVVTQGINVAKSDFVARSIDDFNGDGHDDILWQKADGNHKISLMVNGVVTQGVAVGQSDFVVKSTDDFNGDGHADILWQKADGNHKISLMVNGVVTQGVEVGKSDFVVKSTGDFNNDNKADILWQKADGNHNISMMVDGVVTQEVEVGKSDLCVQNADDFNADGYADILWKKADGNHNISMMVDGVVTQEVEVGKSDWAVQPAVSCTKAPIEPQPPVAVINGTRLACGDMDTTGDDTAKDFNASAPVKRNVSSPTLTDPNRGMATAQNSLERMEVLTDARKADGTLVGGDQVYPLVMTYAQQVLGEAYEMSEGDADIGDPEIADGIFLSLSLDDGDTWKNYTIADFSALHSLDVNWSGETVSYPGHSHKPTVAIEGNNIMVAWSSKYCQENPLGLVHDTVTGTGYPYDYFRVNGAKGSQGDPNSPGKGDYQGSIDYEGVTAPNGKVVWEVPFSCVWTDRVVFDPTDGNLSIQAPLQLTSGSRDTNHIWLEADGVGFAMAWQEDTEGMHAGNGDGPGEGWSGATTNHGTDIWYSSLKMTDFDNATTNFAYPVRITDNEKCGPDDDVGYCKFLCDTYGTIELPQGGGSPIDVNVTRCLTYDTDMLEDVQSSLNGDTGASRPALAILTTDAGEKVVVLGYEETKGLSSNGVDENETNIELEGKAVYFESFLFDAIDDFDRTKNDTIMDVAMPLVSAGNIVSMKSPQENNETHLIYENARRLVIGTQIDSCDVADDADKTKFVFLYKQSFDTKGESSDMHVRANNGFTAESFVPLNGLDVSNVSAQENRLDPDEHFLDYKVDWSPANLTDVTYKNKAENTFSPRAFLRGEKIYIGFEYTPSYRQGQQGRFPNNFHHNIFDGTEWRGPVNVTDIQVATTTSVDARFFSTPAGVVGSVLPSDQSNKDVIFITWGTVEADDPFDINSTTSEGNIYGKRSVDDGFNWGPRFDIAAEKAGNSTAIHEKEVSSLVTPDGKTVFNVWLQETDVRDDADPDAGLDSWFGLVDFTVPVP